MRALLIYWLIGCITVGAVWGNYQILCLKDNMTAEKLLVGAAIWPSLIVACLTGDNEPVTCSKK